jgi:hypothetical protein
MGMSDKQAVFGSSFAAPSTTTFFGAVLSASSAAQRRWENIVAALLFTVSALPMATLANTVASGRSLNHELMAAAAIQPRQ